MPNLWQTICGKVELNESSINACIRETREETGIRLTNNRPIFIFNDDEFDCDVYITHLLYDEIPQHTEPTKMSRWIKINLNEYRRLTKLKIMTPTHNKKVDEIIKHLRQNDYKEKIFQIPPTAIKGMKNTFNGMNDKLDNEPKDALFATVEIYNQPINVLIDTGSEGSVISKMFLDKIGKDIDKASDIKMIGIDGEKSVPLGKVLNVPIKIHTDQWYIDMQVTEAKSYNVILGNDWLTKAKAVIDYKKRYLRYENENETNQIPMSCWQKFKDPMVLYEIEPIPEEYNGFELEEDDSDEENIKEYQRFNRCTFDYTPEVTYPETTLPNDEKQFFIEIANEVDKRFNKVQIEKDDKIIDITKDKKTVVGELTPTQEKQLQTLLQEYEDVIAKDGEIGRTNLYEHRIATGDAEPITQRAYRMSEKENDIIRKEIEKNLKAGIIRPSESSWASPVVLVTKKNGKTRFCVDYRKVNSVTVKDKYPLPLIDEILDRLGQSKWFTSIDLASGYHQMGVAEEDKKKTAFITKYGLYEYNVMPFGLTNAPASFQRLMNTVLGEIAWKYVMGYLDDINIFSKTWDEHLQHLEEVLKRIRKAGLKINPDKCHFATKEMQFLGHIVGAEGIKPDPEKIEKVRNYPRPTNVTEVRRFLGMVQYYRRFIKDCAKIATPLYHIIGGPKKRKNTKTKKVVNPDEEPTPQYKWEEDQEWAFQLLKKALINYPVLKYPDYNKEFILLTDASKIALGAILSQHDDEGKEHPIAYGSQTLTIHQKNYDTTQLEALAIIWALKKYRHYLYGKKFKIITDHKALVWLLNSDKPNQNSKIVRWRMTLQDYDYEIKHKEGKSHQSVDAMSRIDQPNENYKKISKLTIDPQWTNKNTNESTDISTREHIPEKHLTMKKKSSRSKAKNLPYKSETYSRK